MKALDTPVLLTLLEGGRGAREVLRSTRGAELATTEANLLELAVIASAAPKGVRAARLGSLARLRRRITVLPFEVRGGEEVARRLGKGLAATPPLVLAMLGSLEAHGCEELLTDRPEALPAGWRFKIAKPEVKRTKKRK